MYLRELCTCMMLPSNWHHSPPLPWPVPGRQLSTVFYVFFYQGVPSDRIMYPWLLNMSCNIICIIISAISYHNYLIYMYTGLHDIITLFHLIYTQVVWNALPWALDTRKISNVRVQYTTVMDKTQWPAIWNEITAGKPHNASKLNISPVSQNTVRKLTVS